MLCSFARLVFAACMFVFYLVGTDACAAELVSGPAVEFQDGTRAVIRWQTDVATASRVFFGNSQERMTRRSDGKQGIEHQVTLPPLGSGTTWFYTVGSARGPLATNSFVVPGDHQPPSGRNEARSASQIERAPPTAQTWGHLASLEDHFRRHGADFQAKDADDYARMAWEFQQRAKREGWPAKIDADGVVRIFDPKTGTFGAYNRDGTTKTFFKPNSPGYFERQAGTLVKGKKE